MVAYQIWLQYDNGNGGEIVDYGAGRDLRAEIQFFSRKNGVEAAIKNKSVTITPYDCNGEQMATIKTKTDDFGSSDKGDTFGFNTPDLYPNYSAVRYEAVTTVNGEKYTAYNYSIVLPKNKNVTYDDDRMFFILKDSNENIVNTLKSSDISVKGASKVEKNIFQMVY